MHTHRPRAIDKAACLGWGRKRERKSQKLECSSHAEIKAKEKQQQQSHRTHATLCSFFSKKENRQRQQQKAKNKNTQDVNASECMGAAENSKCALPSALLIRRIANVWMRIAVHKRWNIGNATAAFLSVSSVLLALPLLHIRSLVLCFARFFFCQCIHFGACIFAITHIHMPAEACAKFILVNNYYRRSVSVSLLFRSKQEQIDAHHVSHLQSILSNHPSFQHFNRTICQISNSCWDRNHNRAEVYWVDPSNDIRNDHRFIEHNEMHTKRCQANLSPDFVWVYCTQASTVFVCVLTWLRLIAYVDMPSIHYTTSAIMRAGATIACIRTTETIWY